MSNKIYSKNVIISAGTSLSLPFSLDGGRIVGLLIPSTWATAVITLSVVPIMGTSFHNLYDQGGAEYTFSAVPSGFMAVGQPVSYDVGVSQALDYLQSIRLRSGTSLSPVNQSAEQIIGVLMRDTGNPPR